MGVKLRLDVPYQDRQIVKALGAQWDPETQHWTVSSDQELKVFRRWLRAGSSVRMRPEELVLAHRRVSCARCQAETSAYALMMRGFTVVTSGIEHKGLFSLYHVTHVPERLGQWLASRCLTYFAEPYRLGGRRWQNHCLCGAVLEDTELHRPGPNGFRPDSLEQALGIAVESISNTLVHGLVHGQWRANPVLSEKLTSGPDGV